MNRPIDSMHPRQVESAQHITGLELGIYSGGQNTPAIQALKDIRAEYVKAVGWFPDMPDRDDTDRYDNSDRTIHFAAYEKLSSPAVVSMRLTQVDSFEEALSWQMVENNPVMSAEVADMKWSEDKTLIEELSDRAKSGNLWDLTRLVHPIENRAGTEELLAGLVEMIGAGIDRTQRAEYGSDEEMVWIFTITPTVKAALDYLGIKNTELTSGKISAHDNKESYFCLAYPMGALAYVQEHPDEHGFTHTHVENGLRKANAL